MQGRRTAWKEAAIVFGLSRLCIVFLSVVSILVLPQFIALYKHFLAQDGPYGLNFFYAWFRWDVVHYVSISIHAYQNTTEVVFFPLWPLTLHVVGLLLGGYVPDSYYLAGLLLANLFFYFALVLFYWLLAEDFGPKTARQALFYLAFGPYALFFFAGYTESFFILLCIAFFLLLRRGRPLDWWLAGLLGFLAALTRSSGILLAIPFLAVYIQRFWISSERARSHWLQKLNALAPSLLIPAGLLTYLLYLYYTKGNPFIIQSEEKAIWQRHFSLPWDTAHLVIQALFTSPSFFYLLGHLFILSMTLVYFLVAVSSWKHLPLHYSLFALVSAIFVVSFPVFSYEPLLSQPRYLMVIFPITVTLAIWSQRPGLNRVLMTFSVLLFAVNTILFTGNVLVA